MVPVDESAGDGFVPGSASKPAIPQRAGSMLVCELVDLYMQHYAGRDPTRLQRLSWWVHQVGHLELQSLSDDEVHSALERLAQRRSRYFAGNDVDERPIFRDKRKPIAAATVNRYAASLAAVITWAVKRRIAPKGYVHPCRSVERRPEHNEMTRFLSDDERTRLLAACKSAKWPRLYLLVLMGITTGARKGELQGLTWADMDRGRGLARIAQTKNGDPKLLPLVPAVLSELDRFIGPPAHRVFPSTRRPLEPYAFEIQWKEALRTAKVNHFRFHDLRHTCASLLAQSGASLIEIGDLLGHRQLQVTRRYSHLATSHKAALVNRVLGSIQ